MYEFNAGDGDRGTSKPLQSKHRTQAKFDRSVILFNEVIQLFRGSNCGPLAALMFFEKFPRCAMRSLIAIECAQSVADLTYPPQRNQAARHCT
jgi:hypothetical protein